MVTARSEEIDTVVGLEVGADDYVAKPYRLRELVARIRAALRRSETTADSGAWIADDLVFTDGNLSVDIDRHEVRLGGELLNVPLKEFELLSLLIENLGKVLTRSTLIDQVWGHDYVGDTKTLDVHVKRLRGRIEENPSKPMRIVTVRGLGYKLVSTGG
jgi:two-component system response regulator RegX3